MCWVVLIHINKNDLSKSERLDMHLELTKDDGRTLLIDLFGDSKSGIVAHEHGEDGYCHY